MLTGSTISIRRVEQVDSWWSSQSPAAAAGVGGTSGCDGRSNDQSCRKLRCRNETKNKSKPELFLQVKLTYNVLPILHK